MPTKFPLSLRIDTTNLEGIFTINLRRQSAGVYVCVCACVWERYLVGFAAPAFLWKNKFYLQARSSFTAEFVDARKSAHDNLIES